MPQNRFLNFLKTNLSDPLLSFIFPALCTVCNNPLEDNEKVVCTDCLNKLTPLKEKYLGELREEIQPSHFNQLFVVYEFDRVFQVLIHLLKYQRFLSLAELFANALQGVVSSKYDIVTAVPLNVIRERERGYNQSILIVERFAAKTGITVMPSLLERTRNTPSQTKLNREQRVENMRAAFICKQNLNGKKILIIDDVLTTGSTLNACANEMRKLGAQSVDIAALATPVGYFQKKLETEGIESEISHKSA